MLCSSLPLSRKTLLTEQWHTVHPRIGLGIARVVALSLIGLVVNAGCGGSVRFIPANDNTAGPSGGGGVTNQNQNDNTAPPNINDNADDNVEPDPPGGLEGFWVADVVDPDTGLPASVLFQFDDRDEVVGMSVQGTQVNEAIGYASTTRIDDTVQIDWNTDGGLVVYEGILSDDGDRITGTLSAPLTFGSDETFTIQQGTLDLRRAEPDPAPEPEPEPDPEPEPEPDPEPEPEPEAKTLVKLDPITFFENVLKGVDPATFDIGGGTVEFDGGIAATLGLQGLYFGFVDSFAWMPDPGGTATIAFDGLDVRRVDFYFADVGAPGAVLVLEGENGETIQTVQSHTAGDRGDTQAQFSIGDPNGPRISRLVIETPNGVTASLDELVIWALQ